METRLLSCLRNLTSSYSFAVYGLTGLFSSFSRFLLTHVQPYIFRTFIVVLLIFFPTVTSLGRSEWARGLTTQAVKTASQLELRNVFVFAAKTDTSGSLADCSALARPSQLHDFVALHVTLHARLA
jgi:hypothetical protein